MFAKNLLSKVILMPGYIGNCGNLTPSLLNPWAVLSQDIGALQPIQAASHSWRAPSSISLAGNSVLTG